MSTMKQLKFLAIISLGSIAALAAPCDSAHPSNNFCLTGVGNGNVLDGIYVSPYTATVNGVSTAVICDDFYDEVFVPESWQVTSGTIGSSTQGLWGSENSSGYAEVAWLSEQLIAHPSNAGAISYAIWAVFDNTDVSNWLASYQDTTTAQAVFGAGGWLSQAASHTIGNYSNITVYTPVTGTQSCGSACGRPQEFLVVNTPEASTATILCADLIGLGAIVFLLRRRELIKR